AALKILAERVGAGSQVVEVVEAIDVGGGSGAGAAGEVDDPARQGHIVARGLRVVVHVIELVAADGDELEVAEVIARDIGAAAGGDLVAAKGSAAALGLLPARLQDLHQVVSAGANARDTVVAVGVRGGHDDTVELDVPAFKPLI